MDRSDRLERIRRLVVATAVRLDTPLDDVRTRRSRADEGDPDFLQVNLRWGQWWEFRPKDGDGWMVLYGDCVSPATRMEPPVYDIVDEEFYASEVDAVIGVFVRHARTRIRNTVEDLLISPTSMELALAGDPEFESEEYKEALERGKERMGY